MDTPITLEWETVVPGVPSLFHLAVVKIVVPLFNEFGVETLETAYQEIQLGITFRLSEIDPRISKAKEKLLFIPAHLRQSVFAAIMGMHHALSDWKRSYSNVLHFLNPINLKQTKFTCYWRYDGLVDSAKTAQQIVLDAKINIKGRFEFACEFCLEKSVLSLWAEMEASDKEEYLETTDEHVGKFWVTWITEGLSIPWTQAICDYFVPTRPRSNIPHRSSFYPLLPPERRWIFEHSFHWAPIEDLQLCLFSFTTDEKEYFLQTHYCKILFRYLHWPLQDFFLEKFKKMLPIMNEDDYTGIMHSTWIYHAFEPMKKKDYDYYNLFVDAWNASPPHFRECAEKDHWLTKDLKECFDEKRQKRKDFNGEKRKKRTRKNRRLQSMK